MINRTYVLTSGKEHNFTSFVQDRLICWDRNSSSHENDANLANGPYNWDANTQSLILSLPFAGVIIGTVVAMFIYEIYFLRLILVASHLIIGGLNLALPQIAYAAESTGVIIARFAVGFLAGLTQPTNNLVCSNWFPAAERYVLLKC